MRFGNTYISGKGAVGGLAAAFVVGGAIGLGALVATKGADYFIQSRGDSFPVFREDDSRSYRPVIGSVGSVGEIHTYEGTYVVTDGEVLTSLDKIVGGFKNIKTRVDEHYNVPSMPEREQNREVLEQFYRDEVRR